MKKTTKRAPKPKVYHHSHNTAALSAGYTPAEERVMQEQKLGLIREHNAQLEAIKNHTDKTVQHLEEHGASLEGTAGNTVGMLIELQAIRKAIEAFVSVMTTFIATVPAPAKRGRPGKAPADAQGEPGAETPTNASPPAGEPGHTTPGAPSRIHAVPPAPTGPDDVRHDSIKAAPEKVPAPAPTVDELRTQLLDFIAKNGREAGLEKLAAFQAKKITDVPEGSRAAFAASLG